MLTFVGLGLYDERSVTVAGREVVADADRVFAEFYTSRLAGATVADLEAFHDATIEVRDREGVEREPEPVLAAAESGDAAFLTAGDPMIATTHVDLRLRAHDRGIETRVVHGTTAQTAASSLTGLQNYRFGKAVTVPFPDGRGADVSDGRESAASESQRPAVPESVVETVADNRERGLHTLAYLDIRVDEERFLTADRAAALLADALGDGPAVAVARAGSPDPVVVADELSALAERDFGDPLHLLVLPGDLHPLEREALEAFGGASERFGDGKE